MSSTRPIMHGFLWGGVYLLVVLGPVFALRIGSTPPSRGFLVDASLAIGFAAASMLMVQFLLTARFRRATAPFGIDIIYYFHRYLAVACVGFVLLHPVLLAIDSPAAAARLNPFSGDAVSLLGVVAAALIVALVAMSVARKRLGISYDAWRRWHVVFSTTALALTLAHILAAGYYTSQPWKRLLWIVTLAGAGVIVVYIRLIKPARLLGKPWRVVHVRPERGNAWIVELKADGHDGLHFQPGQFVWLTLRSSPFALREHPFSVASSPTDASRVELAIKELGDFTRQVGTVQPGELAYIEGPHGSFSIDRHPSATAYVFIAGGIGIAPIMSMLRALAERNDERPLTLIYCTSALERTPFRDELASIQKSLSLRVVHVLESPPDGWTGEQGWPDKSLLLRHLHDELQTAEYFICGPTMMIDVMEHALHEMGVPLSRIHSELFDLV